MATTTGRHGPYIIDTIKRAFELREMPPASQAEIEDAAEALLRAMDNGIDVPEPYRELLAEALARQLERGAP